MRNLGKVRRRPVWSEPVMDGELQRRHYADVYALMNELRTIGARHAAADRRRSLTGPHRLQAMAAAYETLRDEAGLPASWEVICGAAFAGPVKTDSWDDFSGGRETAIPIGAGCRNRR